MTVTGEVLPGTGTLTTEIQMLSSDRFGNTIIQAFELRCRAGARPIFQTRTVFGFFPQAAFEDQQGLGQAPGVKSDTGPLPLRGCPGGLSLPGDMLLMLDEIVEDEPTGGRAGLGRLRAEKRVDPDDWFFKAHFFQDPVQPGSLGMEAMVQLLQHYIIDRGLGAGVRDPRFLAVSTDRPFTWRYRGQVTPSAQQVAVELEVREVGQDRHGPCVAGEFWLSVDGLRIYHVEHLAVSVTSAGGSR
jgi:3-hydroxymyristoyl/3-hydroxydecanoyl-(acyl carrier protein) dehydratase